MNYGKIAIITDSCCDLPPDYIKEHNIFVLPMHINMPDGNYLDGVNITPEEVYSKMPDIIPSTSQPSPGDVKALFEYIKAEGYKEAIAVCISSGLSGTYGIISMCADDEPQLKVRAFDSKRLSMSLGFLVMQAAEMSESGYDAQEILNSLEDSIKNTNAFFCMPTLRYLTKGGRIGLVAGTLGTLLGIVPTISVNEDGRYYTFAKDRSYSTAIKKIEQTIKGIVKEKLIDIAVMQGNAMEKVKELYDNLRSLDNLRNIYLSHISPALGVHTGPGLVGVAYRIIPGLAWGC